MGTEDKDDEDFDDLLEEDVFLGIDDDTTPQVLRKGKSTKGGENKSDMTDSFDDLGGSDDDDVIDLAAKLKEKLQLQSNKAAKEEDEVIFNNNNNNNNNNNIKLFILYCFVYS